MNSDLINLIEEGVSLLGKDKYEEAMEIFLRAKRINPKDYLVWWVLGNAYKRNNQYYKALDCFLKVIELGVTGDCDSYYMYCLDRVYIKRPRYENIWYELGETYFINAKYKEAIDCYLKSKEIIDSITSYRINGYPFYYSGIEEKIGDAYCKMGQYKEAIDYFLTYKDINNMKKLANAYYSNGQFNEAVEILLKFESYESLGCLYLMNGDYEKAIDSFLKAPNYIIWMELEDVYEIEGLYNKSIDYLTKILETADSKTNIFGLLGISFYKIGNYDEAIHSFLDYTELHHNDYIIWGLLGISYIFNEQYEEALEPLLTATALNPNSYYAWYYLVYLYYKNKKYKAAIKAGISLKSGIYSLENAYYKNGEYKDAGKFFLKNIGISSDFHDLFIILGNSYYKIEEYDKAKKFYLKANELNPDDKTSLEMLEKLNTILKNKEK